MSAPDVVFSRSLSAMPRYELRDDAADTLKAFRQPQPPDTAGAP